MQEKKKILMAKLGLDGHDTGAKILCQVFRNCGFEVIYAGLRQTAEQVVLASIDEDVDVIGISSLSGAHMHHIPKAVQLLKERHVDIPIIVGGTIPIEDAEELKKMGVAEVYPAGVDINNAIEFIRKLPGKKV